MVGIDGASLMLRSIPIIVTVALYCCYIMVAIMAIMVAFVIVLCVHAVPTPQYSSAIE